MLNILKQFKQHLPVCLLIVVLLMVQAWCDLSLPAYTSNIVDIGIQQGGVTSAAPNSVRKETLQSLKLLMTEKDAKLVEGAYGKANSDGIRKLSAKADRSAVKKALTTPDVVLYMASAQTAAKRLNKKTATPTVKDLDTVNASFAQMSKTVSAEQIQARLKQMLSTVDKTTMDTLKSRSVPAGPTGLQGTGIRTQRADVLPVARGRSDAGFQFINGCRRHCGEPVCVPGCLGDWAGPAAGCIQAGREFFQHGGGFFLHRVPDYKNHQ